MILIYTMGKVGSSTVQSTLEALDNVYHIHWLRSDNLQKDENLYRLADKRDNKSKQYRPEYIWRGNHVLNELKSCQLPPMVITLVRDPLARNISSFFQNLELFFNYNLKNELIKKSEDEIVSELLYLFTDEYIEGDVLNTKDANPLTWIDNELNTIFDINIYDTPFPKERGWAIYDKKNVKILLMRQEDLNLCGIVALKKFLLIDNLSIKSRNIGSNKPYSSIYKKFLKEVTIPSKYLSDLYNSSYVKHFYTSGEVRSFYKRWERI